jgi:hypothetical protein
MEQESREGNEMIKKSLIAIALVAFLAGTVQADSPYFKFDWEKIPIAWPYEYKALTICTIPVYMNVGMYVMVKDCHKIKIELQQVDCGDIEQDDDEFPCYTDCAEIKIRANFEVKLGAKLTKIGGVLKDTKIYFDDDTVDGDGEEHKHNICMDAWKAEIWKVPASMSEQVGEIALTVKPNVI